MSAVADPLVNLFWIRTYPQYLTNYCAEFSSDDFLQQPEHRLCTWIEIVASYNGFEGHRLKLATRWLEAKGNLTTSLDEQTDSLKVKFSCISLDINFQVLNI